VRRCYLVAAPDSFERSVIAGDGDGAASAMTGVATVPRTVVVAVTVVPHSHTANGGIDSYLCGSGNNRRGDSDSANGQQTKQHLAHGSTSLEL
jgi:hypothetical protein